MSYGITCGSKVVPEAELLMYARHVWRYCMLNRTQLPVCHIKTINIKSVHRDKDKIEILSWVFTKVVRSLV